MFDMLFVPMEVGVIVIAFKALCHRADWRVKILEADQRAEKYRREDTAIEERMLQQRIIEHDRRIEADKARANADRLNLQAVQARLALSPGSKEIVKTVQVEVPVYVEKIVEVEPKRVRATALDDEIDAAFSRRHKSGRNKNTGQFNYTSTAYMEK